MTNRSDQTPLAFTKMHGLGNDFVIIRSRGRTGRTTQALARALGDRHRGVGFDQLAEIRDGTQGADIVLDFWNSDGSRAAACGNATRCVAAMIMAETGRTELNIRTERGLLRSKRLEDGQISVNMGLPVLDWAQIPLAHAVDDLTALPLPGEPVGVGMGNPHCVFFVDDAEGVNVAERGVVTETDALFPEATNVEFAHVAAPNTLRLRVWERGAGLTLACGSGACAAAVAAHLRGLTGRAVRVELDGGPLFIDWRDDGVWMTGATAHVFDGELDPAFLEGAV